MCQQQIELHQMARNTDPSSSHDAAAELAASGQLYVQRAVVLRALIATPGSTSAELAADHNLDRYMVARRLPELLAACRGEIRTCRQSRRSAMTWWLRE